MANGDEIKSIELRRLAELEKRRAYAGIETEPVVLLEIADLRAKYGAEASAVSRAAGPDPGETRWRDLVDDIDFIRAITSSALQRITTIEQQRLADVRWRNVWLMLLTIGLIAVLIRVY